MTAPRSPPSTTSARADGRRLALWAVLLLALVGCAKTDDALLLRQWTFTAPDGSSRPITIPVHVDADLPRAPSTFVLRARVDLPPAYRNRPLTLAVPFWQTHIVARFDGVVAHEPDPTLPGAYRTLGPASWEVPPVAADHLDVELSVASTWTQAGWIDSVPRISPTLDGDEAFRWWRAFHATTDLGSFVTILLVGSSYAVIFLSGRTRRAAGWFALEALIGAGYPAFKLGYLEHVFGTADVAAVGAMLAISTLANVHFVHAHCKLPAPSRAWSIAAAAVVLSAFPFAGPFVATRVVAPLTTLLMIVSGAHGARIFWRVARVKKAQLHEWIVPLSWPLACLLSVGDYAGWVGLGGVVGELRLASLGIGFIALLQSVGLSREYILALNHADLLNRELAQQVDALKATNREIGHLNEDLRRHIATHSQSLVGALAQASSGGASKAREALAPGAMVSDRYRVVRELGQGGMGAVFEVARLRDDRHFALKALAHAATGDALVRLAREAEVVSHIAHPNVVGVVDLDVTSTGLLYLVMELVDGTSLDQLSKRWGDVEWAKGILAQVAAGLVAIHARGVVHRDLKPSNLLVESATGRVKIADFGISSLGLGADATELGTPSADAGLAPTQVSAEAPSDAGSGRGARSDPLTKTGVVMGTPLYMAPELLRGARSAPPSADVFSFGIIAFELLTGQHPFGEAPITHALRAHRAPAPRLSCAGISERLAKTVEACLSFDPDERPSSQTIADALIDSQPSTKSA